MRSPVISLRSSMDETVSRGMSSQRYHVTGDVVGVVIRMRLKGWRYGLGRPVRLASFAFRFKPLSHALDEAIHSGNIRRCSPPGPPHRAKWLILPLVSSTSLRDDDGLRFRADPQWRPEHGRRRPTRRCAFALPGGA